MKTETLNLRCKLTDEEMLEISKEMSQHINNKAEAEGELTAFKKQKQAEISGHEDMINKLSVLISSGAEYRDVPCEVSIDHEHDTVFWIRQDTGEVAKQERPIPNRYKQGELELDAYPAVEGREP